jgi:hypothetical protein
MDICFPVDVSGTGHGNTDGPLVGKKYLILDLDTKYCAVFRKMLAREGIRVIRLPTRSPNLNAYAETLDPKRT